MKKLTMFLFVICMFIGVLTGCSSENAFSGSEYNFNKDDQYYITKSNGPRSTMAECENGYYFFSGPEEAYLYYMDKSTMKPVLMCNKPDCLHTEETNPSKTIYCNAFFLNTNYFLVFYDSYLYVIGSTTNSPMDTSMSLYKISPDATTRKRLFTFNEDIYNLIIHRGYAYFSVNETAYSKDDLSLKAVSKVYRISLNNTGKAPELLFTYEGYKPVAMGLVGYGDAVYFKCSYYEDLSLSFQKTILYRYDCVGNVCKEFIEDATKWVFFNESLFFCDSNQQIYTCRLNGSDIRKMENVKGSPFGADENYIYLSWSGDPDKQRRLLVYDKNGRAVESFQIGRGILYGGDNKYFFIYERDGSYEYGSGYRLYAIDKSKLANGTATMEKAFEFVPKVQFPGIVTGN